MRLPLLASLGLVLALAPAAGEAQRTGQRGPQPPPDTLRTPRQQDTTRAGVVRQEAAGEVSRAVANRGLTQEQVRELQNSLRAMGCDPGAADGTIGPQTRQALACARRQRGVETANLNDIFRSLGLAFTARDSLGVSGAVATGAAGTGAQGGYAYGDPTFVRDTGVMRINLDTMPANTLGPEGVFVSTGTVARFGGGVWLREVSQERRTDSTTRAVRDTAVYRPLRPPPSADTTAMPVRDPMPPARADSTPMVRSDSTTTLRREVVPTPARADTIRTPLRADTTQLLRPDTAPMLRADTTRGPVADSTLRRMRDELLLTPPPGARRQTPPDTTQPDTTRRTPPDTTRIPPDTTRRRPPPAGR